MLKNKKVENPTFENPRVGNLKIRNTRDEKIKILVITTLWLLEIQGIREKNLNPFYDHPGPK